MLRNYLITALRNLKRHKLYSIINISGLSIGLAIFILAVTFYSFHHSFDNFHKDSERIYILITENNPLSGSSQKDAYTRLPLANLMLQNFPEIEDATVFREYFREIFRYKEIKTYENNVLFTEPNFLKVFNCPIIKGDYKTPLSKPNSVILSESAAKKFFGSEEPLGKTLSTDFSNTDLMITAIMKDYPLNSCFKFDILISLPENYKEDWNVAGSTYSFVKLKPYADPRSLESKFPAFIDQYVPVLKESKVKLSLLPLEDIHLKSLDINSGFNITPVFQFYLIVGIALGLLIIVAINFMVLSTARYGNRVKEVGIRKVVGASKGKLTKQYIGESIIFSVLALPFAFVFFELMRPAFIAIVGGGVDLSLWQSPVILLIIFGVTLFVGFISGLYPAFFLSSIRPTLILKNQAVIKKGGFSFRKILVIFQFSLSFIMIAFTLTSIKQLDMMSSIDLGYNRENVITIPVNNEFYKKFDVLEKELKQNPDISIVGTSHVLPFSWGRQDKMRPEGAYKSNTENIFSYPCGYNFIEAIDIKIVKGRSFSREFNDNGNIIISEETARHFGWEDPLGKVIIYSERNDARKTVIGVAKDFHFPHVFFEKAPAVIYFLNEQPFYVYIKTVSKPSDETIKFIKGIWNKTVPELPFEYSILDYAFEENLRSSAKTFDIFKFISIISVFIACLGLFALASYTVERKTKEIGIRKALGASVNKITGKLISEFLILIVISNVIALPVAYYFSNYLITVGWVYKTELDASLFITASVVSVVAALLAVGIQSVKAAAANPIESLRYE